MQRLFRALLGKGSLQMTFALLAKL